MAKDSRFQHAYRKSASKLHKAVGEVLRTDERFKNLDSFQEYPVNKVNPDYFSGAHKFDWVIPLMKIVIECHGRQHYQVVRFGGSTEEAVEAFHDIKARDKSKKNAALAANYYYIVVPYTDGKKVTGDYIFDRLEEAKAELEQYLEEHAEEIRLEEERKEQEVLAKAKAEQKEREQEARKRYLESQAHQKELKKAREFRQKRYRRLKELKKWIPTVK